MNGIGWESHSEKSLTAFETQRMTVMIAKHDAVIAPQMQTAMILDAIQWYFMRYLKRRGKTRGVQSRGWCGSIKGAHVNIDIFAVMESFAECKCSSGEDSTRTT